MKEKDDEAEEHIPDQYQPEPTGENVTGGDDAIENGEKQKKKRVRRRKTPLIQQFAKERVEEEEGTGSYSRFIQKRVH